MAYHYDVVIGQCKHFSLVPHIRSHRAPCSCFPKKVFLQLSSEQSIGDVEITQLDWKGVPQAPETVYAARWIPDKIRE